MSEAYLTEIEERISEPGHLKKWVEVGFEGNTAFKKVYDTIWINTIANAEKNGWYLLRIAEKFPCHGHPILSSLTFQPNFFLLTCIL